VNGYVQIDRSVAGRMVDRARANSAAELKRELARTRGLTPWQRC
jgi:hypothetical protein